MMKRLILGNLIFFLSFFLISSCSNKGVFIPTGRPLETPDIAAKIGETPDSDPYEIQKVFIDGNLLYVSVKYEGSCSGKDVVEMIGSPNLSQTEIPVRSVKLAIRAQDASCKEYRNRTFIINIRELTGMKERDFETDLQIIGWRTKVRYVFVP
jgi:hypothetical protein